MAQPPDLQDVAAPVVARALTGASDTELLATFCERLVAVGTPLRRSFAITRTLHPVIGGYLMEWQRDTGRVGRSHWNRAEEENGSEVWQRSPLYHMLTTGAPHLRQRLTAAAAPFAFPLFDDLVAEGATDYYAVTTRFDGTDAPWPFDGMLSSWTSDHADGFTDDHIALVDGALPSFVLAMKAVSAQAAAGTLLEAYLGREVGGRVLSGAIDRGSAEAIRAVVWYAELQGFTRIADTAPRAQLIPMLNDYFAAMIGPLHDHGGEVLKLLGDGLLAIFRLRGPGDPGDACAAAIAAAEAARARVEALNAERRAAGLPVSHFTLALHLGEVLYGNIGAPDRLDFTVVGPTVNETARIQAMCRAIDRDTVTSAAFAAAANAAGGGAVDSAAAGGAERLVSLGRYALRGVRQPQELFTLAAPEA